MRSRPQSFPARPSLAFLCCAILFPLATAPRIRSAAHQRGGPPRGTGANAIARRAAAEAQSTGLAEKLDRMPPLTAEAAVAEQKLNREVAARKDTMREHALRNARDDAGDVDVAQTVVQVLKQRGHNIDEGNLASGEAQRIIVRAARTFQGADGAADGRALSHEPDSVPRDMAEADAGEIADYTGQLLHQATHPRWPDGPHAAQGQLAFAPRSSAPTRDSDAARRDNAKFPAPTRDSDAARGDNAKIKQLRRRVEDITEQNAFYEWQRLLGMQAPEPSAGSEAADSHANAGATGGAGADGAVDPCLDSRPHPFPPLSDPCHEEELGPPPPSEAALEEATRRLRVELHDRATESFAAWRNAIDSQNRKDFERVSGEFGLRVADRPWFKRCKRCLTPCSSCLFCNATQACVDAAGGLPREVQESQPCVTGLQATCTGPRF
jgi:hypothetical protein